MVDNVDDPSFNPFASPGSPSSSRRRYSVSEGTSLGLNTTAGRSLVDFRVPRLDSQAENNTENVGYNHPLRSAGLAADFEDVGVTRPHLTRAVDTGVLVDLESEGGDGSTQDELESSAEEEVVIVHEVAKTDSLAGVALKYGITLSDLRRANHLWSSDSIHLRKTLFIPLDKATTANGPQSALTSGRSDTINALPTMSTIRRVPASQLSFFPPSTLSIREPSIGSSSSPPVKSQHTRYATTPNSSLNAILHALPIAASTRDTIMARLSFDSTSSSNSDREWTWQRNGSGDDEGHELDHVAFHPGHKPRSMSEDGLSSQVFEASDTPIHNDMHAPNMSSSTANGWDRATWGFRSKLAMKDLGRDERGANSLYTGISDTSPVPLSVRTVQMEPSPVMQVPPRRSADRPGEGSRSLSTRGESIFTIRAESGRGSKGKDKIRPKLIDVDFGSSAEGPNG
ncbi:hypothetical protein VKT23_001317 [Stygiomarasmius scandens]|uniref:LysM domain-containing protein n=1 Tax=Marasmiellus scandens TaxID=2682957 RepID=A0ABR1K719_9AGAR